MVRSPRPVDTAPVTSIRAGASPPDASTARRYRPEVTAVVRDLVADVPTLTEGKMFGLPAFFVAGKLFACVYGDGVGLKLPSEWVSALLGTPGVEEFRPYGKPSMRQWIQLNRDVADEYAADLELLLESARFVAEAVATGSCRPRTSPPRPPVSAGRRRRPPTARP